MVVAELLGKFEWEVMENTTFEDLARWAAYINIKNAKQR